MKKIILLFVVTSVSISFVFSQNNTFPVPSGNVGIGTTSPATKLGIQGNTNDALISFINSSGIIKALIIVGTQASPLLKHPADLFTFYETKSGVYCNWTVCDRLRLLRLRQRQCQRWISNELSKCVQENGPGSQRLRGAGHSGRKEQGLFHRVPPLPRPFPESGLVPGATEFC